MCTYVMEASTIDVLPTSPQALLSSRFIAGSSIATNIACTDVDLLVWFGPTPNQCAPKWFLIIIAVTHGEVSWLRYIGSSLIKSWNRKTALHEVSLKEQLNLDATADCTLFPLVYIIRGSKVLHSACGNWLPSPQGHFINQKEVLNTLWLLAQFPNRCRHKSYDFPWNWKYPNVPSGCRVSAAYLSRVIYRVKHWWKWMHSQYI